LHQVRDLLVLLMALLRSILQAQQLSEWQCARHAGVSHGVYYSVDINLHAAPVHDVAWVRGGMAIASASGENDIKMR
jgi:hypothetical protein